MHSGDGGKIIARGLVGNCQGCFLKDGASTLRYLGSTIRSIRKPTPSAGAGVTGMMMQVLGGATVQRSVCRYKQKKGSPVLPGGPPGLPLSVMGTVHSAIGAR